MSETKQKTAGDELLEYSVVYTDRALNHMSPAFQGVMKEISSTLREVYRAAAVIVVPGSGTFAMEAVARQFAANKSCLVIRNGWFSYRWSQILEMGDIASRISVLTARRADDRRHAPFMPAPVEDVVAAIRKEKPDLVFAPHVETASGILLPDDYVRAVAEAVHSVGGLFVLDGIASGALWVNMEKSGVDVLLSAPQKGWSSWACSGLVLLSPLARERIEETVSSSFACDLRKWLEIMEAYEKGGHAYHATMPTDALARFRDAMRETAAFGFKTARARQQELGERVRALLAGKGFPSVAAKGFESPGVVVSYTEDPQIHNGAKFKDLGIQIAAGVPLRCNEPDDYRTFRIGLFGLDKLQNTDRTVSRLEDALEQVT